jgi:hypothetical protein
MGAGLSHELSNVFNIINELTGLQQDLLSTAAGDSARLARVADLAGRVTVQVGRGEEINRSLHRLSHSVDEADLSFDVGEVLELFGALAARSARLAEVELEIRRPEIPISHQGDPFAMLLALHACLQPALDAASERRRIRVATESISGVPAVVLSSADPVPDLSTETRGALGLACRALGAEPRLVPELDGGSRIILSLEAGSPAGTPPRTDLGQEG